MGTITLDIDDKNLDTVLTILKSIKPELIRTIKIDESLLPKKAFKYVPKNGIKKRVSKETEPVLGAISLKDDYIKNIKK